MNTLDLTLYKLNEAQYMLNEGLIRTVDIKTTIRLANNFCEKNDVVVYAKEDQFGSEGKNNGLKIELEAITEDIFLDFMKLMNNLGWFSSWIVNGGYKYSEKAALNYIRMYSEVHLVFEAKFDLAVSLDDKRIKNNKLYHVTLSAHVPKIKKIGLVPKAHTKIADHPDRVYLALTERAAFDMSTMFSRISKDALTLLTIDTDNFPDFIKLYSDPNYFKLGVYTLNNIPPHCIVDYKEL